MAEKGQTEANCNLENNGIGNSHISDAKDFKNPIHSHEQDLKISREVGDKARERTAYSNPGSAYYSLGHFRKAIEYHERHLKISKELGDRAGEGRACCNLGNAYHSLGDFQRAIEYHERHLKISKELGNRAGEGIV